MSMRRNVVTLLLWLSAAAIFAIHVFMQHRRSEHQIKDINASRMTEINTSYKQKESIEGLNDENSREANERFDNHKYDANIKIVNKRENRISDSDDGNNIMKGHHKDDEYGSGSVSLQNSLQKLQDEILNVKAENTRLKERENQLRNLARRLAAQLKGKEGGLMPKVDPYLPWIFAISPTYARFTQKADLVRLSQTLMHVTNLHWILVEDSDFRTDLVSRLLQESGISFTHLFKRTPAKMQRKKGDKYNKHHRGVVQRNLGIKWLRDNVDPEKTPGVVYFMDDDNTYHVKIFEEMRRTRRVAVWGVGLVGGAKWAGPIVSNGKVVDFHTNWAPDRAFPIDMSAFAVNLNILLKEKPKVHFSMNARRGYLEPTFLKSITTKEELEPLADNCTKIYVWHTRTEIPRESIKGERRLVQMGRGSDPSIEV